VITVGKRGDLFIGDDGRVFRVSEGGRFSVVAGTGSCCYTGDGGSAASARLWTISGLAAGTSDEIYVSDSTSNSVRVLRPIMRRSRFRQD
jgi:hypothetical protein